MEIRETDRLMGEMEAMAKIAEIMGDLPNCAARARVVRWAADYFCAGVVPNAPRTAEQTDLKSPAHFVIESFEELAEAASMRAESPIDEARLVLAESAA